MDIVKVNIPETEYSRLNQLYPEYSQRANPDKRAMEIVKYYFKSKDAGNKVEETSGGDLQVTVRGETVTLDVKGTGDLDVSWIQLKASCRPSFEKLKKGAHLYRVCSVYELIPQFYILRKPDEYDELPGPA